MSRVIPISELVRQRLADGMSSYDMQARSGDADINRQQFNDIANGKVGGWPRSAKVIKGYAEALRVDERAIVLGFAAQLGIDVEEDRSMLAAMLPSAAADLTPAQTIAIADLVRVFTQPSSDQPQALDLRGSTPEEIRAVMDLSNALLDPDRSALAAFMQESASLPAVARTLQHLATVVDTAIQNLKA